MIHVLLHHILDVLEFFFKSISVFDWGRIFELFLLFLDNLVKFYKVMVSLYTFKPRDHVLSSKGCFCIIKEWIFDYIDIAIDELDRIVVLYNGGKNDIIVDLIVNLEESIFNLFEGIGDILVVRRDFLVIFFDSGFEILNGLVGEAFAGLTENLSVGQSI